MPMPARPTFAAHGALDLPAVEIDAYNAELRDADGFVGDRASNRAFRAILDEWREKLRKVGDDPLGDVDTDDISKKKLDKVLLGGDTEAAGLVHAAIEDFAKELAAVTARFLKLKAWKDTQRIVVGGGLRDSRIGELAIGRASVLLKGEGHALDLLPIRAHPDEAGLIGTIQLAPAWVFNGFDAVLAVDIGGSNIRAGVVTLGAKKTTDLAKAAVHVSELWRHALDKPKRGEAVEKLVSMLIDLVKRAAKDGLALAPFLGVGCPGVIEADGSISRGDQWLRAKLGSYAQWAVKNNSLLIVTWDEDDRTLNNHIPTIIVGAGVKPGKYGQHITHYTVLRTITGLEGIAPIGLSASAKPIENIWTAQ